MDTTPATSHRTPAELPSLSAAGLIYGFVGERGSTVTVANAQGGVEGDSREAGSLIAGGAVRAPRYRLTQGVRPVVQLPPTRLASVRYSARS